MIIEDGHLGGCVAVDAKHPYGDDWTYYPTLWDYLIDLFKPKKIIDIGCGVGCSTKYFIEKGIKTLGIEGSKMVEKHKIIPDANFMLHDFIEPMEKVPRSSLIWCCEFVEHVEEKYVNNFLDVFANSKAVAMTHGFPGQGGFHHVNCQEPKYWIDKMKDIGFKFEKDISYYSRRLAPESHWSRSGLIFTKEK